MKATTDGKDNRSQSSNRNFGSEVGRWILLLCRALFSPEP
jgi:hypothetical protein